MTTLDTETVAVPKLTAADLLAALSVAPDLPHVFDRFWQAPGTQRGGAGLGLAIVKGAVEAHDGRVWIDTHVGQGTTFFIAIPLAPG